MVIAYHLIWTAYGTWLPNDPRGSGSSVVISKKLAALGDAHLGRREVQPRRTEVRGFYEGAEPLLEYPVLRFDATQLALIGDALAEIVRLTPFTCWACAIMPDHVHLVMRKHRLKGEEMIEHMQEATRMRLRRDALVPTDHPVWTCGGWKAFLDSPAAVRSCIAYVDRNPEKEGLERQQWSFVTTYDGWPLGRGRAKPQARGGR